ncbi:NAD(P)H-dependent D-xylose reductase (XR) [Zalerion maritima]|uniref:NAD(P)H-dependent D-xylose reductase (XR) n=1 Tax=Zalerion maritima TaxID=339359 RepID=A0AAD5RKR2_9PEZI|nr:NAD(P)H-dependent D-xylose reductase (XR) [Zalerion maritima]
MGKSTITLASGREMPLVGFGLWKVPKEETATTVYNAIKIGYRLFDGAYDYQNEAEAGEGIGRAISDGLVKREDIFITTKLWNNYHSREHALPMARKMNETWGLGYIDLLLIHFPCALEYVDPEEIRYPGWWMDKDQKAVKLARVPIRETWECLEELVDEGVCRSIGVSNFQAQSLYDIMTYNRHPISSLQVELHPYLVQPELVALAQEVKVAVTAYSSFGPASFIGMPAAFSARTKNTTILFKHSLILELAEKYKAKPAQVLLRWATQRGIAVIPKSSSNERLKDNLENTSFDMEAGDIQKIADLDQGLRFNDPGFYLDTPLRIFA